MNSSSRLRTRLSSALGAGTLLALGLPPSGCLSHPAAQQDPRTIVTDNPCEYIKTNRSASHARTLALWRNQALIRARLQEQRAPTRAPAATPLGRAGRRRAMYRARARALPKSCPSGLGQSRSTENSIHQSGHSAATRTRRAARLDPRELFGAPSRPAHSR